MRKPCYDDGFADGKMDRPLGVDPGGGSGAGQSYHVIMSAVCNQHGATAEVLVNSKVVKSSFNPSVVQYDSRSEDGKRYPSGTRLTISVSASGLAEGSQIVIVNENGSRNLYDAPSPNGTQDLSVTRVIP